MLQNLQSFCSFTKLNEVMTLHFIKDNPLCMLFNLDDWKKEDDDDEEEHKPINYVKFYLAPFLDD